MVALNTNVWVILNTDLYGVESVAFSGVFALAHLVTFSSYTLTPAIGSKYRSPAVQQRTEDVGRIEQAANNAENGPTVITSMDQIHAMVFAVAAPTPEASEIVSTTTDATSTVMSWWDSFKAVALGCCRCRKSNQARDLSAS